MATLREAISADLKNLQNKIIKVVSGSDSFEEAAQRYTAAIYEELKDSIVLIRVFVTIPYGNLPAENKAFVDKLAASKGVSQLVNDQTPVLSLLGTSGVEPAWNDRKRSQGHVGIPLVSVDFIDAIPMMSRLLRQLGLGLEWIDKEDTKLVTQTTGRAKGVFWVPDAVTEVDQQVRKIIAAQDFVATYGVKSVFGFGGGYIGTRTFYVAIIFLREAIEKNQAEQFAALMSHFKSLTIDSTEGKILDIFPRNS